MICGCCVASCWPREGSCRKRIRNRSAPPATNGALPTPSAQELHRTTPPEGVSSVPQGAIQNTIGYWFDVISDPNIAESRASCGFSRYCLLTELEVERTI